MRPLFFSFLSYFLTPAGLVVMAFLDASLIFFLPLGIDFVVIVMAARKPHLFWLYALLAACGSLAGAAGTFRIGRALEENGLSRLVKPRRLERAKARVQRGAAVVAALALIPPPFPFTPFVLACGALEMNAWTFLSSLAAFRLLRFGIEAGLAATFGRQILRWMKTPAFETIVGALIVLAVVGTIVSAVLVFRGTRGPTRDSGASPRPRRTARAATDPR